MLFDLMNRKIEKGLILLVNMTRRTNSPYFAEVLDVEKYSVKLRVLGSDKVIDASAYEHSFFVIEDLTYFYSNGLIEDPNYKKIII